MCMLAQLFKRSTNTHENNNVFFLKSRVFSYVNRLSLSGFYEMSEAVCVREIGTSSAERHNRKGKRSQTIYAPMFEPSVAS